MNEIKITCTTEQAFNIYEKKCLNGNECGGKTDCEHCEYCPENIEFEMTDGN
ncbi:MAG: hypothetical protein J6C33_02385 [Lachnospiraceae bacterium]|nr:hypothetical protein [Lachnospiraceae bacterium]